MLPPENYDLTYGDQVLPIDTTIAFINLTSSSSQYPINFERSTNLVSGYFSGPLHGTGIQADLINDINIKNLELTNGGTPGFGIKESIFHDPDSSIRRKLFPWEIFHNKVSTYHTLPNSFKNPLYEIPAFVKCLMGIWEDSPIVFQNSNSRGLISYMKTDVRATDSVFRKELFASYTFDGKQRPISAMVDIVKFRYSLLDSLNYDTTLIERQNYLYNYP